MKNLPLRILSLVVAIALSYYVHSEKNRLVVDVEAPVRLAGVGSELMVVWPVEPQVRLTLQGPAHVVSQVIASNLSAEVALPKDSRELFVASIGEDLFSLPPSVSIVNLEPHEIEFVLDEQTQATLPIEPTILGKPAEGFEIADISISPSEILLEGPRGEVSSVEAVQTEPIRVGGATASIERNSPVRLPGRLTRGAFRQVRVTVTVRPIEETRTFAKIPIELRVVGDVRRSIRPLETTVVVSGQKQRIAELTAKNVRAFVSLSEQSELTNRVPIAIEPIEGVAILSVTPSEVELSGPRAGKAPLIKRR